MVFKEYVANLPQSNMINPKFLGSSTKWFSSHKTSHDYGKSYFWIFPAPIYKSSHLSTTKPLLKKPGHVDSTWKLIRPSFGRLAAGAMISPLHTSLEDTPPKGQDTWGRKMGEVWEKQYTHIYICIDIIYIHDIYIYTYLNDVCYIYVNDIGCMYIYINTWYMIYVYDVCRNDIHIFMKYRYIYIHNVYIYDVYMISWCVYI